MTKTTSKTTKRSATTAKASTSVTKAKKSAPGLDEVKLAAPKSARATTKTTATKATAAKATAAKATAAKTTATKATATKATATKATATKATATKTTATKANVTKAPRAAKLDAVKPAAKAARTESTTNSKTMIRLESVKPELFLLAEKNGWLRPGVTLDVQAAELVYTTDRWASLKTAALASLEGDHAGFALDGVRAGDEVEYAVKTTLSLTSSRGDDGALVSLWLNNRGHNYTTKRA